ncbi:MAG: S-methyl-5-thioribose-1-phosphate isomerase [Chloroflexi bacterium RBG_16_57_8]|nr:MAG: S-methyl-5-thioribose-1-phosphate isomerase [Chloroflexi bacterium RBG_16_57_8]
MTYQPLEWLGNRLKLLDQTRLPREDVYIETSDYAVVAEAIKDLKVRGAPAIGVAGAYGIALGALPIEAGSTEAFRTRLHDVIRTITATRPTARNLFWAAERMEKVASGTQDIGDIKEALVAEAVAIHVEETEYSRLVSAIGSDLVIDGSTILTHCNTGPLATTGYGTAFGVIFAAAQQGKQVKVLVDETRPLLQGSRLTTWELQKAGISFTLITDSMAGYFMSKGKVDSTIVGADCIAANGDTANKIGTYSVAVLAKAHGIPFYVAAPTSTVDVSLKTGKEIIIEERRAKEITHIQGIPIAPDGVDVANPAFDVTPAKYITAIITERGIIRKPFGRGIATILS